ncbi:nif11-like leader peptide domain protein [Synechococcus sp. BIOS-E4-1]|uniref:Nif11-like leader peptide family natural product precursor n=1 Tax=Synechococcus sp. BIOS-E4-1 TaxID=1400864 RepID=UPI0016456099|nr:Nif11-like leader peptide family natural product precursor [Synechococcus sp. BIOS-E4-1]QNI54628.1 nif11-like leader peptide domain protein [Synechococcus sp. BIOS-E4-1]
MSLEQLKAFLAKVKDGSNLLSKLKAAKSPEDVVGIAKEHGYEFSADKLSQLSEKDLEGVTGGKVKQNWHGWTPVERAIYYAEGGGWGLI